MCNCACVEPLIINDHLNCVGLSCSHRSLESHGLRASVENVAYSLTVYLHKGFESDNGSDAH